MFTNNQPTDLQSIVTSVIAKIRSRNKVIGKNVESSTSLRGDLKLTDSEVRDICNNLQMDYEVVTFDSGKTSKLNSPGEIAGVLHAALTSKADVQRHQSGFSQSSGPFWPHNLFGASAA